MIKSEALFLSLVCAFAVAGAAILIAPHGSAHAQSGGGNAAPVCMVRTAPDGSSMSIMLPASDQGAMIAKSFAPQSCNVAFATLEQRETWLEMICQLAAIPDARLQEQFAIHNGERPQVLCGMAEQAIRSWRRGGQGGQ